MIMKKRPLLKCCQNSLKIWVLLLNHFPFRLEYPSSDFLCRWKYFYLAILFSYDDNIQDTNFQFDTMCTLFAELSHCYSQPICQDPLIIDEMNQKMERAKSGALQSMLMGDDLTPEERARAEMGWDAGCAASPWMNVGRWKEQRTALNQIG